MNIIHSDLRRIVVACGKALGTGRAVPMILQYPNAIKVEHRWHARQMRSVIKYEKRRPVRGTRKILQRALAEQERLVRAEG